MGRRSLYESKMRLVNTRLPEHLYRLALHLGNGTDLHAGIRYALQAIYDRGIPDREAGRVQQQSVGSADPVGDASGPTSERTVDWS